MTDQTALDLTTDEVARLAGVSYRQIDTWIRFGYLSAPAIVMRHGPGWAGRARAWTSAEARVAAMMGRLVTAGFTPRAAAAIARSVTPEHGCPAVDAPIGAGINLRIEP